MTVDASDYIRELIRRDQIAWESLGRRTARRRAQPRGRRSVTGVARETRHQSRG